MNRDLLKGKVFMSAVILIINANDLHWQDTKENTTVSSSRESNGLRQRRKNMDETKEEKKSWIDPPEEPQTVTLAQAEIESCMQRYEVGCREIRYPPLTKNSAYVDFPVNFSGSVRINI